MTPDQIPIDLVEYKVTLIFSEMISKATTWKSKMANRIDLQKNLDWNTNMIRYEYFTLKAILLINKEDPLERHNP